MAKGRVMLTPKMISAAKLLATGRLDYDDIGKKVGCCGQTVRNWAKRPDFMDVFRAAIGDDMRRSVARAYAKLSQQIDAPDGWLAQGAAREVLNRAAARVMGEDTAQRLVVSFGDIQLGTPGDVPALAAGDGEDVLPADDD